MKALFFITIIFLLISGCKTGFKKTFKKEYYTSGELKSYGWYINDSIPIDTLFTLYEKGKLSSIDIFDSSGLYVKSISYYVNGNIHNLVNFKNGLGNGFLYSFNPNGKLNTKTLYLNDLRVGDAYSYNDSNIVTLYNFYDWQEHNINLIKYDDTGKIVKDFRQNIFIDSLRLYLDSLDKANVPSYELLLVISNPPKCKSVIKIDYLTKSNRLIKSDSVFNKNYFLKTENLPDSISTIFILGSQYDSIKRKTVFQKSTANLVNQ